MADAEQPAVVSVAEPVAPVLTTPDAPAPSQPQTRSERRAARMADAFAKARAEGAASGEPASPASAGLETPNPTETAPADGAPSPARPPSDGPDGLEPAETGDDTPLTPAERRELADARTRLADAEAALREAREGPRVSPSEAVKQKVDTYTGRSPVDGSATYDDLQRLIRAKDWNGLAVAKRPDGQLGYSAEEAIDQLNAWDERQTLFESTQGIHKLEAQAAAWGTIGGHFDSAVKDLGLDIGKTVETVKAAVAKGSDATAEYLKLIREAERKAAASEWRGKYDTEVAAHKATRARLAASGDVEPESGNQGGPSAAAVLQQGLKRNRAETIERMARGEFANLDLRDAG